MSLLQRHFWALAVVASTLFAAAPARADVVYTLDQGSLGGLSSFGTVTLTQIVAGTSIDPTGTVHVTVNLLEPSPAEVVFAKSGAGEALTWNLTGVTNVSITNITTGFGVPTAGSGGYKASPYGSFDYAVACFTGCGNGTSPPRDAGPLQFDISGDGLSLASFIPIVVKGVDIFFTADLGVDPDPARSSKFATGVVGASGPGVTIGGSHDTPVPEPASLLLLASGAALLALCRRRA